MSKQNQPTTAVNATPFDFLVFIGRFQPFHKGHQAVVNAALANANQVIVLCGSAHRPRTLRNPWTFAERKAMIRSAYSPADNERLHIAPLIDVSYDDDLWVQNVQQNVAGIVAANHTAIHNQPRIGLIGHQKDASSYYLKLFPQWQSSSVPNVEDLNATSIRVAYLANGAIATDKVSSTVAEHLQAFQQSNDYAELRDEYAFIAKYKAGWDAAPYAPIFVTVDALVIQSGHILLVERKARPGKGLFALPGGFLDADEQLLDACIRELREETRLKVPDPVLRGSVTDQAVFDDPHRSARGRTITHAYTFQLKPDTALPKVKGSDDAKQAVWLPLGELDPSKMFEDHYFIIQKMIGAGI